MVQQGTNPSREMSNKVDGQNPADEDRELVRACQKGNVDAFETLVERHQKRMLNMAFRVTGDYEEACEIVQESFLSAYRAIRKFRGEAKFSTWLYGITLNHARNRLKQIRSRASHEGPSLNDPVETQDGRYPRESSSQEGSALEAMEKKELQEKVQDCISMLDVEHREVLVLRDVQGFSYDEIRDILKLPDGTVKSRLFRAREALKDHMKGMLGGL
jgi:RNA polymerase sigma-70 factor, ECF subfamily